MPKVIVTQENPNFDYSGLNSFGDVEFVTHKDFSGAPSSLFNDSLLRTISAHMERFDPANDYIVPSGSPFVTSMCMVALRDRGVVRFPLLRWSKRDQCYQLLSLNFPKEYAK